MPVTLSSKTQNAIRLTLVVLVGLAFVFELIRDSQRDGDFVGYIHAGNAVLHQTPIYADYLNTWPPFFAVFAVPLALLDAISPLVVRLLWLLGIIVSWFYIIKLTVVLEQGRSVTLKPTNNDDQMWLLDWRILLPFLFVLRFVIDDLSNIQINSYLLLACLFVIQCQINGKPLMGGIILGLIISLKVYPVFLFLFLIYKGDYRLALSALTTIFVTIALCLSIYGWQVGLEYFGHWWHHKVMASTILIHKNQSLFPWIEALLTNQTRGLGIYYNVADFDLGVVKKITYAIIGSIGLIVAGLFRFDKNSSNRMAQFAFILAAIPILSPLAWKYYFVFLFPLLFIQFNRLYNKDVTSVVSKVFFVAGVSLAIMATDGLLTARFSDVLEVFGCITWAAICMMISYLVSFKRVPNLLFKA